MVVKKKKKESQSEVCQLASQCGKCEAEERQRDTPARSWICKQMSKFGEDNYKNNSNLLPVYQASLNSRWIILRGPVFKNSPSRAFAHLRV